LIPQGFSCPEWEGFVEHVGCDPLGRVPCPAAPGSLVPADAEQARPEAVSPQIYLRLQTGWRSAPARSRSRVVCSRRAALDRPTWDPLPAEGGGHVRKGPNQGREVARPTITPSAGRESIPGAAIIRSSPARQQYPSKRKSPVLSGTYAWGHQRTCRRLCCRKMQAALVLPHSSG
jgi:hypothetical protein